MATQQLPAAPSSHSSLDSCWKMEWPPTIFNVTELPTIFNSSGFIDTNSSMEDTSFEVQLPNMLFNDSFPNGNSTSVGSDTVASKRHCQLVIQMSLLALLFLAVFFVSSNKWRTIKYCLLFVLLYVVQLFAHAVSWCLGCCQCYGGRPRASNDLMTSNNDLIEPTEVVVTGGGPGQGQLNVIDLVEAPPSFAAAHEAIHLQGLKNVNLHHCGNSGVETKKIANQENVLVHKINEEKQMMNTIEEEDELSKELVETDVNKLPMGSLDKEKINKMSIEWEMMKILDRANKMEIEDEEKRLEFGMSKNTETVKFTNKENVITDVEYKEPMNTIDEEDVLTKENENVEFGKQENVTKNSHESELMNAIEAEDRIQKKTEGKDNLGFDLQEEGEVMKTFDKELENIDIEESAMLEESQMSPLNLSKDENMQTEISKESEIVNMILDDSAIKKKNEGSLVGLQGELAAPDTVSSTAGTDAKMADGDRIDQTVVSAEPASFASNASNASKPDDAYLQLYLGPEAYDAGFYI